MQKMWMCATRARATRQPPTPSVRQALGGARWWASLILPKDLFRYFLQPNIRANHGLSRSRLRWQWQVIVGRSSPSSAAEWGWELLAARFSQSIGLHS